jgi:Helix-turn-helix domain
VYRETPIRYLTRRRIERAQDLLRSANLTVTEVCMVVGFASLGSFSSRFAQLVGESPTAYRDRWAARGGPHVPGCFLFMKGALDPGGTTGPITGSSEAAGRAISEKHAIGDGS